MISAQTSPFLFASDEFVAKLRRRFLNWKEAEYTTGDELLFPIFDQFLAWDHVAPIFSCQGHTLTNAANAPEEHKYFRSTFYLMLGLTEKGFPQVSSLYGAVRQRLIDLEAAKDESAISSGWWGMHFTTRQSVYTSMPGPHPVMLLDTHGFPNGERQKVFFSILLEELQKLNAS